MRTRDDDVNRIFEWRRKMTKEKGSDVLYCRLWRSIWQAEDRGIMDFRIKSRRAGTRHIGESVSGVGLIFTGLRTAEGNIKMYQEEESKQNVPFIIVQKPMDV